MADIRFCAEEHLSQVLELDQLSPHPWPERVIVSDLCGGRISYLGAFAAEGQLLGYAALGEERGSGLLMNLLVAPERRRLGLGLQLVVAAAEFASDLGFSLLALRVRVANSAAIALYKSLGFKTRAMQERFYSNGDPARYMSVRLPLSLRTLK
ncbi:MAG: GNAT family N-acetyltransferase [Synergistaceae bacterium]|nr:GNAT family N-acetyltransferase [Synergistaceae bacterium]